MGQRVNHPNYYNSNSNGVECIEIIRWHCTDVGNSIKYLWRLGLKEEEGLSIRRKAIEDANKALWYIKDRIQQVRQLMAIGERFNFAYDNLDNIPHPSGYCIEVIFNDYEEYIRKALIALSYCGMLYNHNKITYSKEIDLLLEAFEYITTWIEQEEKKSETDLKVN